MKDVSYIFVLRETHNGMFSANDSSGQMVFWKLRSICHRYAGVCWFKGILTQHTPLMRTILVRGCFHVGRKVGLELPAPFDFSKILGHDAIPWIPGIPSSLFYFSRSSHRFHLHGLLFPCFHINPSNPVEIMTTLSKVVLSKVNKTKLVSFIEDEKKKPLFLDDSSEGVDDFTSWKYFQQHPLRLKMKGHSSAWAPGFVEKVKHQRFFEICYQITRNNDCRCSNSIIHNIFWTKRHLN